MKQAVRQVMHRSNVEQTESFGTTVAQKPLEPCEISQTNRSTSETITCDHTVQSFPVCHDGSYAVVDTGCQRSAVGINTLRRIMEKLPSDLNVKFASQQFRFSGIGGDTITKQVALIPVCLGTTPGMLRAAILEDTAEAPLLLSLPILQALGP